MNLDGTARKPLMMSGDLVQWSPDSSKIAYRGSDSTLYILDKNSGQATSAARYGIVDYRWSPNGNQLAFVTQQHELYVVNIDGSAPVKLSAGAVSLTWSPDGKRVAFGDSPDSTTGSIYIVNIDGTNQTKLTEGASPDWSPDGAKFVFIKDNSLSTMNNDGSGIQRLTNDPVPYSSPSWSGDGKRIGFWATFYISTDANTPSYELRLINADGSGHRRIPIQTGNLVPVPWISPNVALAAFRLEAPTPIPIPTAIVTNP
jgi:Tol biopolymer transport system component